VEKALLQSIQSNAKMHYLELSEQPREFVTYDVVEKVSVELSMPFRLH